MFTLFTLLTSPSISPPPLSLPLSLSPPPFLSSFSLPLHSSPFPISLSSSPEILEGKRAPSYLVYSTGKGEYPSAGGLSGRIKGITTVFFMAVLLGKQ